jgi:hypothetical protein
MLPEVPVMTARTVSRMLGVSFPAAKSALEELLAAGILTSRQVERNTTGYLAREVLDLLGATRSTWRASPPPTPPCWREAAGPLRS